MTTRNDALDQLRRVLSRPGGASSDFDLNPGYAPPKGRPLRPAAVLVAFQEGASGLDLLLTKRSSRLKHHPGQIAFPGGKVDPVDDGPTDAALREAREEVGLPGSAVEIIGTTAPHETVTGFLVTPVFGIVRDTFTPIPEPGEVAEIFRVPFDHVTDPARYSIQGRRWRGQRRLYYTVPYGPYYIWGATARMLRSLTQRLME